MRRRDVIRFLGSAPIAWPLTARAREAKDVSKIGVLYPGPEDAATRRGLQILEGLRSEGFRTPDQVTLVSRATEGDPARLAPLTTEIINSKVDIIIAVGPAVLRTFQSATASIPIVAIDLESDPVENGWIESFAHPSGNVTGFFLDFPEFSTKWLQLLKEIIPGLASLIVLWDPNTAKRQVGAVTAAAQRFNIKIEIMEVKAPTELGDVLAAGGARHPDGLLMLSSPLFSIYSKRIAELALKYHLPAISMYSSFARAGGLIAYGFNLDDMYREIGVMAGKLLKGTKPADLPVERPTHFELVVNLKTAEALNLTIPTSLQVSADEVIE
jgi:putative tryptophan/tyrosine transport system substrate-binding protein